MRRMLGLTVVLACVASMTACWPLADSGKVVHEQQWIVDSIGRDIAEMLLFAATQNNDKGILQNIQFETCEVPGSDTRLVYSFKLKESEPEQKKEIELVDFVWSPRSYMGLASELTKQLKLQPENSNVNASDANSSITALSNYSSEVIAEQNKRISDALTAHPLDPNLHEQAALLATTFAMRESASCFDDRRPALNRITAHLSLARSLRGENDFSEAGKLAEAALMCMGGREAEGVARIDALGAEQSTEATKSWLRALKISATHDYRLADLDKAAFVERVQYGRALADDIGADYLTDYLKKQNEQPTSSTMDWLRVGARGIHTVEAGHIYAEPGVQAEMADFARDFKIYHGRPLASWDEATEQLGCVPTRCLIDGAAPRLEVLSWGDMSAFHARHLLDSVFQKFYFENSMWGVPDEAKATWEHAEKAFAKVKLFPLCKMSHDWVARQNISQPLSVQLNDLLVQMPASVNSNLWHRIQYCPASPDHMPKPETWFKPRFLFGTAFDYYARNYKSDPHLNFDELEKLRKISPYNRALLYSWVAAKYPHHSHTGDQYAAAFGNLADLDIGIMKSVAEAYKADPAKYIQQLEKMARYKPDYYFDVAENYVKNSQPEKAKVAYENGVRHCRDSVTMSNKCAWLVNYYFDHGQADKALTLAKEAAEVYSYFGLKTLADLYERMGNLSSAEKYYVKILDRYEYAGDLAMFYRTHTVADKRFQVAYNKLVRQFFPGGLLKINPVALKGAPKSGVILTSTSDLTEKYGLKEKDVFVAINGYRMDTTSQYHFLRNFDKNPTIEFTVWNGNGYRTVKAVLPRRKWECDITDFEGN